MFSDDCYAMISKKDSHLILSLNGFEEFLDFYDGGMCFKDDIRATELLVDGKTEVELQHIGDEGVPLECYLLVF